MALVAASLSHPSRMMSGMRNWNSTQRRANLAKAYRRVELADGRLVEWSEVRASGRPRACLGYLDGRSIDDATLHDLIGPQ